MNKEFLKKIKMIAFIYLVTAEDVVWGPGLV